MEDSTIIKGFRLTLKVSFDWVECIQNHIREVEQKEAITNNNGGE